MNRLPSALKQELKGGGEIGGSGLHPLVNGVEMHPADLSHFAGIRDNRLITIRVIQHREFERSRSAGGKLSDRCQTGLQAEFFE